MIVARSGQAAGHTVDHSSAVPTLEIPPIVCCADCVVAPRDWLPSPSFDVMDKVELAVRLANPKATDRESTSSILAYGALACRKRIDPPQARTGAFGFRGSPLVEGN